MCTMKQKQRARVGAAARRVSQGGWTCLPSAPRVSPYAQLLAGSDPEATSPPPSPPPCPSIRFFLLAFGNARSPPARGAGRGTASSENATAPRLPMYVTGSPDTVLAGDAGDAPGAPGAVKLCTCFATWITAEKTLDSDIKHACAPSGWFVGYRTRRLIRGMRSGARAARGGRSARARCPPRQHSHVQRTHRRDVLVHQHPRVREDAKIRKIGKDGDVASRKKTRERFPGNFPIDVNPF